jgi:hypothetical protein
MLVGVQFVIIAVALFAFATVASAHTAQITIGCTQVQFNYSQFPDDTPVSAHEAINIDGQPGLVRIFLFNGPSASDVVKIVLTGSGSHTVEATTNWSFFGQPQGSASDTQTLTDCTPTSTTTSSPKTTSTTVAESTTIATTTTTIPTTTTTMPTTSSTVSPETTTSIGPSGSTTTIRSTTTVPVTSQGATTTIAAPPTTTLPFTGSSTRPVSFAFALVGLGLIALGASARRSRL